jgi:cysteinyl-tRNA synthetase
MKIYNTLSKEIEEISTINNGKEIGLYACGPTVYDHAHIGHARKYTMDDVLVRTLAYSGFQVKHVMNITDVGHLVSDADTGEDKIEKAAKKQQKSAWDIAREYEDEFREMLLLLNLRLPDVMPRATEHIAEQIALVQQLEEKGFTYRIENDGMYFDTSKDPHYGELARLRLQQQHAGARVDAEGKRQGADFALWKFSPANEQRQMEWDSPWGRGFPGWHIECSAMSMKYLGEQFELHTGGIDHIPVHHTNEIAQSENGTGKRPFVKYWVHHNFLLVDGQKMSKSLGNFYTLQDVLDRGYSPLALKMLYLGAHYRDELNFTWESLAASQRGFEKLQRRVSALLAAAGRTSLSEVPDFSREQAPHEQQLLFDQFAEALQTDLRTPQALATLWKTLKQKEAEVLPLVKLQLDWLGLDFVPELGLEAGSEAAHYAE